MERLKQSIFVKTDNTIIDKMHEAYDNCPTAIKYLNDLKVPEQLIRDNIIHIFDFVSDINYCKNCPGVKKCSKNNPVLCTKITYENGILDHQLVPCKEFLKRISFEKQFLVKDFPEEWLDNTLRDVDKAEGRIKAINKYNTFIKDEINNWIYLTGGVNSGRSFLAAILTVDAVKKEKGPAVFLNCQNRIQELYDMSFKDKDRFKELIEKFSNVPIFVLDDFGNEFKNDFIRDSIVLPILYARSSKRLFTIITSDFNCSEILELYSTSKAGAIRAKQLASTIKNNIGDEINLGDLPIYK